MITSNLDFQNHLLDLSEQGYVLVTESERFAHQLQWRYRLRQSEAGRGGWEPPRITSFNQWLERFWEELWPEAWPASAFTRWRLLGECLTELPPPEGLSADIALILAVDESFDHCLRYGMDPGGGEPANRLVEWRRALWPLFHDRLESSALFHPASHAQRAFSVLSDSPGLAPHKMAFIGFEFAGHWERRLVGLMGTRPENRMEPLPLGEAEPRSLVFTDPEQELYGMLEDLAAAANQFPLHELAVAVLDPDLYAPLIANHFGDLFGAPLVGEKAAYNLFPDRPLTRQPLFQAALLPFDFANGGQSRLLLLSLLRSPYYGYLTRWSRALSQWDWTWRLKAIDGGLKLLMDALDESQLEVLPRKGEELIDGLTPFLGWSNALSGSLWIKALRTFWHKMEFPVLANELDQMAWQRLCDLMERFESEFGAVSMKSADFAGWLQTAAERVRVQKTGYEDAGIQVLGPLEARGLAFRRLYVPGLVSGTLPQPARSLPFLSGLERKKVQGGSAESQFAFAGHLFGHYRAVAPELVLSRPMMNQKGESCLPSPFWPEGQEEKRDPVIPWRHELPSLRRAWWVREGILGIAAHRGEARDEAFAVCGSPERMAGRCHQLGCIDFLGEISVSALDTLLSCSSRFFFGEILEIEPLPEIQRGLDPPSRGKKIHEILAVFGWKILHELNRGPLNFESLCQTLRETIQEKFKSLLLIPYWSVEVKRLSGTGTDVPGLLIEWLRREWDRFQAGWQWAGLETPFSGMKFEGCSISLKGRLDRLDVHPEYGTLCWDYKTGKIPGSKEVWDELSHPQLPLYLMAIRKGLIKKTPQSDATLLGAGYIDLQSIRYLRHIDRIKTSEDVELLLARCEEQVRFALDRLECGDVPPRWLKARCDLPCPYGCLCGFQLSLI